MIDLVREARQARHDALKTNIVGALTNGAAEVRFIVADIFDHEDPETILTRLSWTPHGQQIIETNDRADLVKAIGDLVDNWSFHP